MSDFSLNDIKNKFSVGALRMFEPERAHAMTIAALRAGHVPEVHEWNDPILTVKAFGRTFPNPLGLAAGFDKNADVPDAMLKLGFGFVEVGTVTPFAQDGNPRPRIFRLPRDHGVINRLGFNNLGLAYVKERLMERRGHSGIVGANLGANKDATDRMEDYQIGLRQLYGLADYFTINISSPNTPGLRALQSRQALEELVDRLFATRDKLSPLGAQAAPILIKVAPDLTEEDKENIAQVALEKSIDGLIVSNTTIGGRETLKSAKRNERGGLSGEPVFALSTRVLADMYRMTKGEVTLVGVGGVSSGRHAFEKIKAGATLVQLYTALTYEGPGLITRIKQGLADLLKAEGYRSLTEAIGTATDIGQSVKINGDQQNAG